VRTAKWTLLVVSTVLLVSYGGAILLAPVTVPLVVLAARNSGGLGFKAWAGTVVVLTVAELAWALTYVAQGEATPAIWLVPTLAAAGAAFGYSRLSHVGPAR